MLFTDRFVSGANKYEYMEAEIDMPVKIACLPKLCVECSNRHVTQEVPNSVSKCDLIIHLYEFV